MVSEFYCLLAEIHTGGVKWNRGYISLNYTNSGAHSNACVLDSQWWVLNGIEGTCRAVSEHFV